MPETVLEVRDLHVNFNTYEGTAMVINGIDLKIQEGESVALVGETGCGKSVTVKTIMGLLPQANVPRGEILFRGEDLLAESEEKLHSRRGKEISLIMQDPMTSLNPVFTIGEQMMDILKYQGQKRTSLAQYLLKTVKNEKGLRKKVIEQLEQVQLSAPTRVFESYPVELSGGMRQRVLIAMALLADPDLLIADEPGTALDVTTESKILELLEDLIEETDASVLYITHDLGVARNISDKTNVMYAGEIVEKAPTEVVFESPKHPYSRGLLDSVPQLAKDIGHGIEGELPEYTDPPTGCRFADRCPHAQKECYEFFPYRRKISEEQSVGCHLYSGPPDEEKIGSFGDFQEVDIGGPPREHQSTKTSTE